MSGNERTRVIDLELPATDVSVHPGHADSEHVFEPELDLPGIGCGRGNGAEAGPRNVLLRRSKLTLLNRLKNSARNWSTCDSPIDRSGIFFMRAKTASV